MRLVPALAATTLAAAALAVVPAGAALAEERACRGSLGAVTVDNLRVPSGHLHAERHDRQGHAQGRARRDPGRAGIRVVGNVQGEGAASVQLTGATVGGSVQVKQGGGAPSPAPASTATCSTTR
jgi:hypothetical protein